MLWLDLVKEVLIVLLEMGILQKHKNIDSEPTYKPSSIFYLCNQMLKDKWS